MKVLLSPNPYRDRGLKTAMTAKRILEDNGAQVVICLPFDLEDSSRVHLPAHQPFGQMSAELEDTDVLVCFGGDGTILHAARDANPRQIPVLGVNLGSVGFMAELEQHELSMLSRLTAAMLAYCRTL